MRAQAHTIMMHGVIQSKGGVAILRGSSDDDGRSRLIILTIKETRRFHLGIRVGVSGRGIPPLTIRGRAVLKNVISRSREYEDAKGPPPVRLPHLPIKEDVWYAGGGTAPCDWRARGILIWCCNTLRIERRVECAGGVGEHGYS